MPRLRIRPRRGRATPAARILPRPAAWLRPLPVLLILAAARPAFSQQKWERTYGGTSADYGYSVEQTAEGGYVVAGYTSSFGNGEQVYLVKTDSLGNALWSKTYGGVVSDLGYSVQQTQDRGYILSGWTNSYGNYPVYLIKTDSLGDTLWTRTYSGMNGGNGLSVQQTQDGGYVVAGVAYGVAGPTQVFLIRTNPSGDTVWTRTYGSMPQSYGYSVQQTQDGGYIVAGLARASRPPPCYVYLLKTDASGDTVWTRTYGWTSLDAGRSVQQTQDGGYIVTGFTLSGNGYSDVYLLKINPQGDTVWTRAYGGTGAEVGNSVRQTGDGGYIIAGYTGSSSSGQVYLLKTDSLGDTLWTRTYGGAGEDYGESVEPTGDGGYIVGGYTASFGDSIQVYLIKTDAFGSSGVTEAGEDRGRKAAGDRLTATPNPFGHFTRIPGHEDERFDVFDLAGRKVGTWPGLRIGAGLSVGVFFVRGTASLSPALRVVKIR